MPQVSITINRPEVSVSTTTNGPTVTISETPVAITQNTSEIAVTTNPQVVQINTAATTIQTTTLDEAFQGDWNDTHIYHRGDLVRYESSVYVYINTTPQTTLAPDVDTDLWVLLFSESGLTGTQVLGLNRAVNLTTWDPATQYSVGDIVIRTEEHDNDGLQNQPFPVLYRLYSSTGSINVDPLNHHDFPGFVDNEPVYTVDSAWQKLVGVCSINGYSGDVSLDSDVFPEGSVNFYYTEQRFDDSFATKTTDDLAEGSVNVYWTTQRFDDQLATKTTDDLAEGTNLYWTTARGDQNFADNLGNTTTDDLTEGTTNLYHTTARVRNSISATGDIAYNSTTGVISYSAPTAPVVSVNGQTGAVVLDTDDISEGSTNQYYTTARFDTRFATKTTTNLAEGTNLYYTTARANADFDTRLATKTTTNLAEGTNLYYTTARANSDFDTRLATKSTTNLAEGTNLYFTNSRARSALSGSTGITYNNTTGAIAIDDTVVATHAYVGTQIANLVDSAPSTLDTLNELAAALGDDPNFATTITTALGNKLNTADFTTTANTWYATSNPIQNNTTDDLAEGTTNLYHTTARARNSISGGSGIGYNATTGEITADVVSVNGATGSVYLDTDDISEGATNQYFTTARARSSISASGSLSYDSNTGVISYTEPTYDTDDIAEGTTNLYYTDARSRSAISLSNSGIQGGLTYNSSTGVFNYVNPNTDETAEGLSNLYFTQARARESLSAGTGVSYDNSTGVISIGQSVGTGDSPSFAGLTAGNISVGVDTDNTIASTNTNGNIVLDPNGTGNVVLASNTRLQGELQASTNLNYVFPAQTLNTVTDNNGYSAASSFPAGSLGYGANMSYTTYYGDTFAGNATSPALLMRNANGNSVAGEIVPFTGLTSVAPSATLSNETMGTFNYNGYATTAFTNDQATQYQGGGTQALHALQIQAYSAENFSDSTLTLSAANITAVASSFRATLGSPQVTGTRGQISFTSTTPGLGNAIRVTGTLTGTATGIVSGNTYYIVATNGSTTATLSATPGGPPITTTAGTLTGLTLTRCGVTFTLSGQTSVPFGRGALVTVSGVNNITNGTYPVFGTPSATSVSLGVPHTVAPTLSGSQTFSCPTAYMASGYRIRTFPLATPGNQQNRVNLVDHTAAAATYRANSFTWAAGGYGTSGSTFATLDANEFKPSVPIRPATTAAGNFAGGSTYTPAATITNGVSATINSGTGGFTIALTNLLSAGESGHYQFYVNNTSGSAQQITTTGGVVNINHNLASGSSMMITVYIVDTAAFCEHIA